MPNKHQCSTTKHLPTMNLTKLNISLKGRKLTQQFRSNHTTIAIEEVSIINPDDESYYIVAGANEKGERVELPFTPSDINWLVREGRMCACHQIGNAEARTFVYSLI